MLSNKTRKLTQQKIKDDIYQIHLFIIIFDSLGNLFVTIILPSADGWLWHFDEYFKLKVKKEVIVGSYMHHLLADKRL